MTQPVGTARRRMLLAMCVLIGVLLPSPVLAHVKWFTDPTNYPVRLDFVFSERTLLWITSSAFAVMMLYLVQRTIAARAWPWTAWLGHMAAGAPGLLAIQAGICLIATAVHPALLSPNLDLAPGPLGLVLSGLQVVVAFTFITGFGDWLGGCVLIALVGVASVLFSPTDALEQIFWVGIGVSMLVIGRDAHASRTPRLLFRRPDPVWRGRAILTLRVLTGLSLVIVALTEKLWNPSLGRAFLLERPELNVFQSLPDLAWFSDDMFVLTAGLAEAAIGAMLISGFAPRLVILAMWLPFNLGIPVLPAQELLGHLPILGIMYLLLVEGAGVVPTSATSLHSVASIVTPARLADRRGRELEFVS